MGHGLSIKNDRGEFLVSSDYTNYVHIGNFSLINHRPNNGTWRVIGNHSTPAPVWVDNYFNRSGVWYCDIPSVNRPMIALKLPTNTQGAHIYQAGMAILSVTRLNAAVWRVFVVATQFYTPAANCVVAFSRTYDVGPSSQTHGIRVYGGDGSLSFDSGRKPMLINGVWGTWMGHARNRSNGQYLGAWHTSYASTNASIGTYFTGNCARITNTNWQPYYASVDRLLPGDCIFYQTFSITASGVVWCNWSPILLNAYPDENALSITSFSGAFRYHNIRGTVGDGYYQWVLLLSNTSGY